MMISTEMQKVLIPFLAIGGFAFFALKVVFLIKAVTQKEK